MEDPAKGCLVGIMAAVGYGFSPVIVKILLESFDPVFLAGLTSLLMSLFLFSYLLLLNKDAFKKLERKDLGTIALIGFLGTTIAYVLVYTGISIGKATEAAFLIRLEPVFALLIASILLDEKMSNRQVFGILVMLAGVYALTSNGEFGFSDAAFFFITVAILYGFTDVLVKKLSERISPALLVLGRSFFGFMFLLPLFLTKTSGFSLLDDYFVLLVLANAFVVLMGTAGIYYAIKYLKTGEGTMFALPAPIITAVLSRYILGEVLSPVQGLGALLILLGLYVVLREIE